MDRIEEIRINKLIDSVENDDLGEALDHLKEVVKFKQEAIKNEILKEKFVEIV
jgi:hypothetical protein